MAQQIKIFYFAPHLVGRDPCPIEKEVNTWLESQPGIEIVSMQASLSSRDSFIILVHYRGQAPHYRAPA